MGTKVCYIVGAGGSCAYDFPSGPQLVDRILDLIPEDACRDLDICPPELDQLDQLKQRLKESGPESIDVFIQRLQKLNQDPEGRLRAAAAYAMALIFAKLSSSTGVQNCKDDWLTPLIDRHHDTLVGTGDSEISFVTFNYDTMIERYLYVRLTGYIGKDAAAKRLQKIPIVHVHGQIPYVAPAQNMGRLMFPGIPQRLENAARAAAKRLLFFWENDRASNAYAEACTRIHQSEALAIIGVGQAIAPLIRLLEPVTSAWWLDRPVSGTTYGLDNQTVNVLSTFLQGRSRVIPRLHPAKAREFMQSYLKL